MQQSYVEQRKPRVLVDCDGVLADFIGGALATINERCGTSYTREQVTEFNFTRSLGMTPQQAAATKRIIGNAERFALNLDVYPGAVDGVRRLREIASVHIVTSPWNSNPTWTHDREAWLLRHFGIQHGEVTHTSAKDGVFGHVLIDDKTSTCEEWRAAWPNGVAVLWSTPHNRRDLWDGPSTSDWDHLIEIVRTVRP